VPVADLVEVGGADFCCISDLVGTGFAMTF
jgi:hypothetical protein